MRVRSAQPGALPTLASLSLSPATLCAIRSSHLLMDLAENVRPAAISGHIWLVLVT